MLLERALKFSSFANWTNIFAACSLVSASNGAYELIALAFVSPFSLIRCIASVISGLFRMLSVLALPLSPERSAITVGSIFSLGGVQVCGFCVL